jgi:hypothetical protein
VRWPARRDGRATAEAADRLPPGRENVTTGVIAGTAQVMSERVQRRAADRRDAAEERAANAAVRAERNRERGEDFLARRHEGAAECQQAAADAAERMRLADVAVEGERLGEPGPAPERERAQRRGARWPDDRRPAEAEGS